MHSPTLDQLPPPPPGKTGFPWTQARVARMAEKPWPRVSIITPSFNQAQFLEETIRSVLLQDYPDLEYIIIDGGSVDGSAAIIRKYEKWLAHWRSEKDRGQAEAINKGMRQSSGAILGWLNSDDCLAPGALQHVAAFFHANPRAEIVCGFRRDINAQSRFTGVRVYLPPDRFSLARSCYIAQEATFWKRSVWERVGELDESYQFTLDFDLWQRMLAASYTFELLPRYLSWFRIHPQSKGSTSVATRRQELARIYRRYLHTDKTETELRREINPLFWRRRRALTALGALGLLNHAFLARVFVSWLTMPAEQIPNRKRGG